MVVLEALTTVIFEIHTTDVDEYIYELETDLKVNLVTELLHSFYPVHRGQDSKGSYYQWGNQTKYYYDSTNERSRELAKEKANKQGKAIESQRRR